MRSIGSALVILAFASGLVTAAPAHSDTQVSAQRRGERPLVPRSHGRRQADRAAQQQVYVPGHFAWDRRKGQYSWVSGRWERYDPTHAFVGAGWQFRNGQWTFGPAR
ncbi:MAG: hypothetical protein ACO1NY_12835 [Pseudorhodoplanes sp.]